MSGKIIVLPSVTYHDVPPDRILQSAIEHGLSSVVIAGYDADGKEYFASSLADGGDVLWLLERLKKTLLEVGLEDAE